MTRAIVLATILLVLLAFFALTYELANKVNPDSSTSRVLGPVQTEETSTTTTTVATTTTTQKPKPIVKSTRRAWSWDALAACESGGRWDLDAFHDGGLQFAVQTWASYAPADFPPYAYQATREQQILVAERVLADQGPGAWPVCSYKVGMR